MYLILLPNDSGCFLDRVNIGQPSDDGCNPKPVQIGPEFSLAKTWRWDSCLWRSGVLQDDSKLTLLDSSVVSG